MLRTIASVVSVVAARVILLAVVSAAAACGSDTAPTVVTTTAPYSAIDLLAGTGAVAGVGNRVTVSYTGWLHDSSRTDAKGTQFDSSTSFAFTLGTGAVIAGWDRGVAGMRVGGQRRLVLPPELAYGSAGAGGGRIPPNATLVFDITLLNVQ